MGDINDDKDTLGMMEHEYRFCNQLVFIEENFDAGLGGTMWDGSACLANYIEYLWTADPAFFKGKRILELGAGCSLPGLLCSRLDPERVILSDIPDAMEMINENISRNKEIMAKDAAQQRNLENTFALVLEWTSEKDMKSCIELNDGKPLDIILASDCVYDIRAVEPFLHALRVLATEHTLVFFGHPKARNKEASDIFWASIVEDFLVEKVSADMFNKGKGFKQPHEGVFVLRKKKQEHFVTVGERFQKNHAERGNLLAYLEGLFDGCCGLR